MEPEMTHLAEIGSQLNDLNTRHERALLRLVGLIDVALDHIRNLMREIDGRLTKLEEQKKRPEEARNLWNYVVLGSRGSERTWTLAGSAEDALSLAELQSAAAWHVEVFRLEAYIPPLGLQLAAARPPASQNTSEGNF